MRTLQDFYQDFVVELDPILWEMGRVNGIWVNNDARLELLSEMNHKVRTINDESQAMVPDALYPLKRYKNEPDETTLAKLHSQGIHLVEVPNEKVKTCHQCGAQHVTKAEHTGRKGGKGDTPLNLCYKAPIDLCPGTDLEYDVVLQFNPGSDDQLRAYAELHHHRLGRNWRTGEDTLDAKQVQKFIDKYGLKHPIYAHALEVRKVRKARGYAKAWIPDELGKLYGQFKNVPETFRLSQAEHNFQNVSHRGDVPYAEELRTLLIAKEGYMLVEGDSASVEAVFTGIFMGSPSYVELAKKGIHAAWALQTLGKEVTPENIRWIKNSKELQHQLLYERKKRTVHGVSYGMGAKLLYESYRKFFASKAVAQAEIDDFYRFVPDLKQWHDQTRKVAHKQGFLTSPWGLKNYYYRVYSYDTVSKEYRLGEDAKAAIAFQPQHANAMFQRENLKRIHAQIDKRGKKGKWFMTAIGQVHDSNGLAVPEDDVLECKEMLEEVMTRPVKEMGNIVIGVEVKAGKDWGHMERVK